MDFLNFLANNIPLYSLCAVMLYISFRNLKVRKNESIYFIVFTAIVLFLSIVVEMEKYAQRNGLVVVATIFTFLGYISRPVLLFLFILLANMDQKRSKLFYSLITIPLIVNFVIYSLPLFFNVPGISTVVFHYELVQDAQAVRAVLVRGTFLNFTSHFISAIYLAILAYVSMLRFKGKHRRDGVVIVLCVIIIIITVTVEILLSRNDLLNIVCEICAMINYIFILSVNASKDTLTNLYDRRTFEEDISKFKESVNGIIQIDMNELKFLNDTYGHSEGDKALHEIASIIENSSNPSTMCVYRLSGDEFVVLMFQGKEIDLLDTVKAIKDKMEQSKYNIAIGSFFYDPKLISFKAAMKQAEKFMYIDKSIYYKQSGRNRRSE